MQISLEVTPLPLTQTRKSARLAIIKKKLPLQNLLIISEEKLDEQEIYRLALKAKDGEIDLIDKKIEELKNEKKILLAEREKIRLKSRSELQIFIEKYPGLSPDCDQEVKEFRARNYINRPENEILAEIDRINRDNERWESDQRRANSPG